MLISTLFTSCFSTRNTAKVKNDVNGAYIAPKGFTNEVSLSNGAFYADGTVRIGISNVFLDANKNYVARYLAEEQPDLAKEILRTFKTNAFVNINDKNTDSLSIYSNLKTTIEKVTDKSNSLNLARSILYRYNENIYNGANKENLEIFSSGIVSKLIDLQSAEFIQLFNSQRAKLILSLEQTIKLMKENKVSEEKIKEYIESLIDKK